LNYTRKTLILN